MANTNARRKDKSITRFYSDKLFQSTTSCTPCPVRSLNRKKPCVYCTLLFLGMQRKAAPETISVPPGKSTTAGASVEHQSGCYWPKILEKSRRNTLSLIAEGYQEVKWTAVSRLVVWCQCSVHSVSKICIFYFFCCRHCSTWVQNSIIRTGKFIDVCMSILLVVNAFFSFQWECVKHAPMKPATKCVVLFHLSKPISFTTSTLGDAQSCGTAAGSASDHLRVWRESINQTFSDLFVFQATMPNALPRPLSLFLTVVPIMLRVDYMRKVSL